MLGMHGRSVTYKLGASDRMSNASSAKIPRPQPQPQPDPTDKPIKGPATATTQKETLMPKAQIRSPVLIRP